MRKERRGVISGAGPLYSNLDTVIYSFISYVKNYIILKEKMRRKINVMILGDGAVGKTSILQ